MPSARSSASAPKARSGCWCTRTHGPWIALRGAWLVDVDVPSPKAVVSPCVGCPAPCVGGPGVRVGIERSTSEMRTRCIVGAESRYDDAQIAFHYGKAGTAAR